MQRLYETPEQLYRDAMKYFDEEDQPTMAGLQSFLCMTRAKWHAYKLNEEFSEVVQQINQEMESRIEAMLLYSKNQTGSIFWLKNHAQWRDTQHTENVNHHRVVISDTPMDEDEWQRQNS